MSTTMTRTQPGPVKSPKALRVTLWVAQVLLAAMFVMASLPKLSGDPTMVEIFAAVGAGQWLRYVVGVLELAGAIGLLVPRLCGVAALGLALLLVGAALTNIVALGASPAIPIAYLLFAAAIAWFRRASIRTSIQTSIQTSIAASSRLVRAAARR